MKPDDPRVTTLACAIVALRDGLATTGAGPTGASSTGDELVPLTPEALAARQFEHRSIVRLAKKGELRTVRIGRRRYTRAFSASELPVEAGGQREGRARRGVVGPRPRRVIAR